MLRFIICYAECQHAGCRYATLCFVLQFIYCYAECQYAGCRYAKQATRDGFLFTFEFDSSHFINIAGDTIIAYYTIEILTTEKKY
jgi:hypothetical protein